MRLFLYDEITDTIDYEVLAWNKGTSMMRVRCRNGIEYERVFLIAAKHNERFHLIREDDDAKLTELRARYQAGRTDREGSR